VKFSADVPDDLIADAAAAWARINDRRAAEQRQEVAFDDDWARTVLIQNLGNILSADTHELENEATNRAVQAVQLRVAALNAPKPAVDVPAAPIVP
jgi:hypothetical protein